MGGGEGGHGHPRNPLATPLKEGLGLLWSESNFSLLINTILSYLLGLVVQFVNS